MGWGVEKAMLLINRDAGDLVSELMAELKVLFNPRNPPQKDHTVFKISELLFGILLLHLHPVNHDRVLSSPSDISTLKQGYRSNLIL